jgi:hypothetical protein
MKHMERILTKDMTKDQKQQPHCDEILLDRLKQHQQRRQGQRRRDIGRRRLGLAGTLLKVAQSQTLENAPPLRFSGARLVRDAIDGSFHLPDLFPSPTAPHEDTHISALAPGGVTLRPPPARAAPSRRAPTQQPRRPHPLWSLPSLRSLDLFGNELSGSVPGGFPRTSSLREVDSRRPLARTRTGGAPPAAPPTCSSLLRCRSGSVPRGREPSNVPEQEHDGAGDGAGPGDADRGG